MSDEQLQELQPGRARATLDIPLQLSRVDTEPGPRHGEPVRLGVPFPRGRCAAGDVIRARDEAGAAIPVQSRVLERWSDDSARWVLLDLRVDSAAPESQCIVSLEPGAAPALAPFAREDEDGVTVETGAARFRVDRRGAFPFADVSIDNVPVIDPASSALSALDEQGRPATLVLSRVHLEESGPVRAVVLVEGTLRTADAPDWLVLVARLHFVRGLAHVECHVTLRNPRRAAHPGGLWDLGDAGSVLFKDVSLTWQLASAAAPAPPAGSTSAPANAAGARPKVRYSAEVGQPFTDAGELLELYQDSSGGENWRSPNHLNRLHEIPVSFRGYRLTTARGEQSALRATPIVSLSAGTHAVAIAMRDFWQNCPKAIDAGRDGLTLRLFPKQFADLHELQGGEQKTHTFIVSFGHDGLSLDPIAQAPLTWARTPVRVHPSPAWYCEAQAAPYLTPRATDQNAQYLALVDQAIAGEDTFIHKREVIDQYGWRHFGDLYGDHEAVREPAGAPPLISHYNNQYDVVGGFACQFMRSGDWRWKLQMDEMAAHVTDIDLYHTDQDKAAYNHGLFWHTYHYVDVDTGTHRSYPAKFRQIVHGGGPSSEQNYATGLMLHYFMTGNLLSRDAAIGLARFVIAIDDGTQTVFRWLDRGYTGLASASGNMDYHGPGRGPGNSIAALLDGHRLTGDRAFLDKAEQLMRRCIHPADDLPARKLLDAERRWYYTMFLQAIGKFLDHKAERGELDDAYAYGRASLLHYARWMAANEHPYLDKPEILEYPTETWPAQDMRKSLVFAFAARHAEDEPEQARFLERARFFFDYSTRTLTGMKTRALARPVVLLLSNGFAQAWFQQHTAIAAPRPARPLGRVGPPRAFIPQRNRAKRRAVMVAAAGALAGLLGAAALIWWLW